MANTYTTVPGELYSQGTSSLVKLADQYKDNPEIAGLVTGSLADAYKTQANTALSLQYNDAYQASLAKYQGALEDLRMGNTLELMGEESAITEKLAGQQIGGQKDIANIQGATARYGYDQDLRGIESQVQGQLGVADRQLQGTRYVSDQELKGTDLSTGRQLQGQLGVADRQLRGTQYVSDQELKGTDLSTGRQLQGVEAQVRGQLGVADKQSASSNYASLMGFQGVREQAGAARYAAGQQAGAQRFTASEQAGASRYASQQEADSSRYASRAGLEGVREQAGASRYAAGAQAGAQRYTAEQQAGASRYGSEKEAEASRYASDTGLAGVREQAGASRFAADITSGRQLEGQKYGYDSQERQIGLTGEEERKSTTNKYARETESQIGLRNDARGAIARAGSRFYG